METVSRREQILHLLQSQHKPVSGTVLSRLFQVSRQVIVQDIALLRAENKNILSTNKGYVLFQPTTEDATHKLVVCVSHSTEDTEKELNCIVDNGGYVLDVSVDHDLYGQISADLIIKNRADVLEFIEHMTHSESKPLKVLTSDVHYHTIEASDEAILKRIENKLDSFGFLIKK